MCWSLFSGLHHIKINKLLNYHFKQFSTSTLLMGVGQSDGWVCWYLVMHGLLTGVLVLLCRSRNIIGQIIFHNMLNRQEEVKQPWSALFVIHFLCVLNCFFKI